MRGLALLVVFLLASAGCLSDGSDDSPTVSGTDEQGLPVVVRGDPDQRQYDFDLTDLTYASALKAFRIVAHEDTIVNVEVAGATGSYASEDDCFAVAAFSPAGQPLDEVDQAQGDVRTSRGATAEARSDTGFGHVHFAWRNNGLEPRVEVAGNQVKPGLRSSYGQGAPIPFSENMTWSLPAGESVIVQAGGKTDQYIRGSDAQPNSYRLKVAMGASHIEALPDVPVRCGVGVLDLDEEIAHAQVFISAAAVGGEVIMETKNATTFLFIDRLHLADQERSAELLYPGLPAIPVGGAGATLVRTSNVTGTAGFIIDYWVGSLSTFPFWFLADTQWPGITWADP